MTKKQFANVSSAYGAPTGRREFGDPGDTPMALFRVNMVDGDYDDGGAYWGGGRGVDPLYCLRGTARFEGTEEEVQRFVRAKSRAAAFLALQEDYPDLKLKCPIPKGQP